LIDCVRARVDGLASLTFDSVDHVDRLGTVKLVADLTMLAVWTFGARDRVDWVDLVDSVGMIGRF